MDHLLCDIPPTANPFIIEESIQPCIGALKASPQAKPKLRSHTAAPSKTDLLVLRADHLRNKENDARATFLQQCCGLLGKTEVLALCCEGDNDKLGWLAMELKKLGGMRWNVRPISGGKKLGHDMRLTPELQAFVLLGTNQYRTVAVLPNNTGIDLTATATVAALTPWIDSKFLKLAEDGSKHPFPNKPLPKDPTVLQRPVLFVIDYAQVARRFKRPEVVLQYLISLREKSCNTGKVACLVFADASMEVPHELQGTEGVVVVWCSGQLLPDGYHQNGLDEALCFALVASLAKQVHLLMTDGDAAIAVKAAREQKKDVTLVYAKRNDTLAYVLWAACNEHFCLDTDFELTRPGSRGSRLSEAQRAMGNDDFNPVLVGNTAPYALEDEVQDTAFDTEGSVLLDLPTTRATGTVHSTGDIFFTVELDNNPSELRELRCPIWNGPQIPAGTLVVLDYVVQKGIPTVVSFAPAPPTLESRSPPVLQQGQCDRSPGWDSVIEVPNKPGLHTYKIAAKAVRVPVAVVLLDNLVVPREVLDKPCKWAGVVYSSGEDKRTQCLHYTHDVNCVATVYVLRVSAETFQVRLCLDLMLTACNPPKQPWISSKFSIVSTVTVSPSAKLHLAFTGTKSNELAEWTEIARNR